MNNLVECEWTWIRIQELGGGGVDWALFDYYFIIKKQTICFIFGMYYHYICHKLLIY